MHLPKHVQLLMPYSRFSGHILYTENLNSNCITAINGLKEKFQKVSTDRIIMKYQWIFVYVLYGSVYTMLTFCQYKNYGTTYWSNENK
jgi:hypothetical protein